MVFKYMIRYSSNCPYFRAQYVSWFLIKFFIKENLIHNKNRQKSTVRVHVAIIQLRQVTKYCQLCSICNFTLSPKISSPHPLKVILKQYPDITSFHT